MNQNLTAPSLRAPRAWQESARDRIAVLLVAGVLVALVAAGLALVGLGSGTWDPGTAPLFLT